MAHIPNDPLLAMLLAAQAQGEGDEEFEAISDRVSLKVQIADAETLARHLGYEHVASALVLASKLLAKAPLPDAMPRAKDRRGVVLPFARPTASA